jgi:uncharacterized membrane protein
MKNEEKIEHELFDVSILLKGIHALIEIVSGISVFLVSPNFIFKLVNILSFGELTESPVDSFSQYLLNITHGFLGGTKQFIAFYLFSHGVINLILVFGLFKKKMWAYYASFIVLTIFALYQMYKYIYNPSLLLIILTIFDLIVIWLIWGEYRRIKKSTVIES